MLDTYRSVFRTPDAVRFCVAAFVMRMPIALYPIGLVLIISARTGRYGFAGLLSGIYVIANGVGNPLLARLSDRFGQRRLLVPASIVHASAAVLLAVLVTVRAPDWSLIPLVVVAGFAYVSVGSLVRARWSYVLAEQPTLSTAYSLESTLDEVIFVVGPLIATILATQLLPVLVLYLGAALVLGGAVALAAARSSEPPPAETARPPSALRVRGMSMLTTTAIACGAIFASAEVTFVAFCGQHGHRSLAGAPLAAFALGSAVAGLFYGSRTWRTALLDRFRLQSAIFAALTFIFLLAVNIPVLMVCAFVAGLGIAPTLITSFGMVEQIMPARSLTEGLAWVITGLSVGYGAGASVVGRIADAQGARTAFSVTIAAGLVMAGLAALVHRRLRPAA